MSISRIYNIIDFKMIKSSILISLVSILFPNNVTFSVDLSNEDMVPNCAPTLAGTFNDWNFTYNLTSQGAGLWTTSLDLDSNSNYEYKFGICGWSLETLPQGSNCTNTSWGYTNRELTTTNGPQILDTYYYGTCDISLNDGGSAGDDGGEVVEQWDLVWSDEFNGTDIDMSKWSYEVGTGNWGWGNNESQYYTDRSDNSYISNGKLVIEALLENYGGSNYTSARMVTKNKGDWTYGRFEVRAKLPSGTGTWPAIWMMPTDSEYGGWPDSGEIDIMEHVGFDPGVIHGNCHNDTYNWMDGIPPSGGDINIADFDDNFHIYTLEWSESSLKWFVDDILYHTYTNTSQGWSTWPYSHDFFFILNIAIGGTWGGQQGIDNAIFPQKMEIDYVRVYENTGQAPSDSPKTTFLVDMNNETVVNGNADYPGVYVSGSNLNGPAGILMNDNDSDGVWELELELEPGTYTYKFRNGFYDYWDGPGWESSDYLSDCGVGEWNDREFSVYLDSQEDVQLGPYCFGSCIACENNNPCSLLGDINDDSLINILDVVLIVNIILGAEDNNVCSDYNQDQITDILDVVSLVSIIMGNS